VNNYEWLEELAKTYSQPSEIPVEDIRELAHVVGIKAALKVYKHFDGIPQFFPKKNLIEMEKEYIRRCSLGKSDVQVARKLNRTLRHIQDVMSKPSKPSGYIPMFPELENEEE